MRFGIIFVILATLVMGGCATVPSDQVFPQSPDVVYLMEICDGNDLQCDWDQVSQIVSIRKNDKEATALIDSNLVLVGERQITLDDPLRLKSGRIIVPNDFQRKVVGELDKTAPSFIEKVQTAIIPKAEPAKPVITGNFRVRKLREVILDAGHGGKDPGTIGYAKSLEKEVVLDITKRLKRMLEEQGIKVHMTRTNDKFISLQDRTAFASRTKADAFISIHANSAKKRSVQGVEVFALRNLSAAEKNDVKRTANRKIMLDSLAADKSNPYLEVLVDELMYSHKQGESYRLAQNIGKDLSRSLKIRHRGTKTAGFYVLRNTLIPAVLVEVGFLSNPKEERMLKSGRYREKVARSIARSLIGYSKGQ